MPTSATVLRTENLSAFYQLDAAGKRTTVRAVDRVEIHVQENEVYGIAGESGCGKTTLLKAMYAAIEPPLRLVGGKVLYRVDGREVEVTALSQEERRKLRWVYISYVPQGRADGGSTIRAPFCLHASYKAST